MRILVIDDSEDSRDIAEGTLLSGGYDDVVTAASGWEALKRLDIGRNSDERPTVDIVLIDVVMPEMDGVETCARIRNDPRYADLPIIMVTSRDDMDTLTNAFVAGATDYVSKPVNRVELIARVRAALRLKAELDRRQARERELLGFLSSWGNRRASLWIDEATGLLTVSDQAGPVVVLRYASGLKPAPPSSAPPSATQAAAAPPTAPARSSARARNSTSWRSAFRSTARA